MMIFVYQSTLLLLNVRCFALRSSFGPPEADHHFRRSLLLSVILYARSLLVTESNGESTESNGGFLCVSLRIVCALCVTKTIE